MCHANAGEAMTGMLPTADQPPLEEMGLAELREVYRSLFQEESRSKNLPWLRRRISSRLHEGQLIVPEAKRALSGGEASEMARSESPEVSDGPIQVGESAAVGRDSRLPRAGAVLSRTHKGVTHEVEVGVDEFRYRGSAYRSLSAIGREITGHACNGFLFFRLGEGKARHGC